MNNPFASAAKFEPLHGYYYLKSGDITKPGDEYDLGGGKFVAVGSDRTWVKVGVPIPDTVLCYHPRRKK